MKDRYEIRVVIFDNIREGGCNVLSADQDQEPSDWHLELLEDYVREWRERKATHDLC